MLIKGIEEVTFDSLFRIVSREITEKKLQFTFILSLIAFLCKIQPSRIVAILGYIWGAICIVYNMTTDVYKEALVKNNHHAFRKLTDYEIDIVVGAMKTSINLIIDVVIIQKELYFSCFIIPLLT